MGQLLRVVADGMQQVGPAQAETAVDEQRVACRPGGFGYGDRGSVCEAVVRAKGECLEGVPRYERAGHRPTIGLYAGLLPVCRDGLGHQVLDADSCNQPSGSPVMHPGNHISNPP